jgi:3-oxoacyl-[acyl-carrier protein] reductase
VNNAGVTKHVQNHANLDGLTKDDFLRLYAVNTVGPQMVRACRSLQEAAPSSSVLLTSSIAAVTGMGSSVAMQPARALSTRRRCHSHVPWRPKIRVNAICPGFMDTRWFSDGLGAENAAAIRANVAKSTPLQLASRPEDIAESVLFLIADAARHITGETLIVDAGMHLGYAVTRAR